MAFSLIQTYMALDKSWFLKQIFWVPLWVNSNLFSDFFLFVHIFHLTIII